MKRTSMRPQRAPRPDRSAEFATYAPRARPRAVAVSTGEARVVVPMPKSYPLRSETYRRLVAALPCAMCGAPAPSQAAHADFGKGLQIKSDDRTCFPLCADAPGWRGCHSVVGASGSILREHRRELERKWSAQTRRAITDAGLWPASLPRWGDE